MSFNIPILFLIFNRLDTTKIVFEEIKKQAPKRLYIASDGPRADKPGESELVVEIRAYILKQIDWECDVHTLFRDENLGCKNAVSGAISWFFDTVEMGIILEDDCVPSKSFFPFCEELLIKYKDDNRVWHIDGTTSQKLENDYSYQFSKYCLIWGWATWKRAWNNYDPDIKTFPEFKNKNIINSIWNKPEVRKFWLNNFDEVYNSIIDTWDFQWAYAVWKNNGMSIRPSVNLIKNIGFNNNATHTQTANKVLQNLKNEEIDLPLKHTEFMLPNVEMDDICSYVHFDIRKPFVNFVDRVKKKLKKIVS